MSNNETPMPDILEKVNRRTGMTVPDDYFDDFAARMADKLEPKPWEQPDFEAKIAPRSIWQRMRPYVYMAAMFAGVWCMMKVFDVTRGGSATDLSISARPELAQALNDPKFVDEYVYDVDYAATEADLMDSLWEDGFDPAELDKQP